MVDLFERGVPIVKADVVVQEVKEKKEIEMSSLQVKQFMKDHLGLGFKKPQKIPI